MGFLVFLLFVVLPVAEIMVLGRVAARIGFWNTFAFLLFSAIVGGYLAKVQGKVVLMRMQQCMAEGRTPTREMIDGLLIFFGGVLFVFPGFISDILGFIMIFPLTRWLLRELALNGMFRGLKAGRPAQPQPQKREPSSGFASGPAEDAEIIE